MNELAESGKVVAIVRDGKLNQEMNISDVMVGDVLFLRGGIEIPGDGVVIEANSVKIDESSLTGETEAMDKNVFEYCMKKKEKESEYHMHTLPSMVVLSGTKVLTGTGKMVITAVGKNSAIG